MANILIVEVYAVLDVLNSYQLVAQRRYGRGRTFSRILREIAVLSIMIGYMRRLSFSRWQGRRGILQRRWRTCHGLERQL